MRYKFLFILLLLCVQSYAQKVRIDRVEADGTHHVMTSPKKVKFGKGKYNFSLAYYQKEDSVSWRLVISSYTFISESSEILIKLGNDSIINLKCSFVNEGSIKDATYGIYLGAGITYYTPETEKTYYTSVFEIPSKSLDDLDYWVITKIRFFTGTDYYDKKIYDDEFGKFIAKSRKNIQKRITQKSQKSNLYNGF